MQITVNNDNIIIDQPDINILNLIRSELTYTDKSKQYQLRRMGKTAWGRAQPLYKELQAQVKGILYKEENGQLIFPSSFYHEFKDHFSNIIDNRKETGSKIVCPWVTKPYDLRPYQQEAVDLMLNGCHDADQEILMFDGSTKKAKNISVGDQLMGPDSKPRNVLSLVRGQDEFYNIMPKKGKSFLVNGKHILSLRRSYSSKARSKGLQSSSRAIEDDLIVNLTVEEYLKKSKSFKHKYKLYKSGVIEFKEQACDIPPYILGLWLGDGSKHQPEFSSMDSEIEQALTKYALSIGANLNKYKTKSKAHDFSITDGQDLFRNKLKRLNLICNKYIPECYKISSVSQRLELLAGLIDIDTDGSYYGGIFDITQKSLPIAESIVFIARSLGLAAYLKPSYKAATNSKDKIKTLYYRVTISGDIDAIPTRLPRKQAKERRQIKNVNNIGFTVEKTTDRKFYGFSVDRDHLYLMDDFIVTHNCNHRGVINFATGLGKTLVATHFIKAYKRKTLVICPSDSVAKQFYNQFVECFGKNKVGFYGGGKKKINDITVSIAASVTRNVAEFQAAGFGAVIFDEVHHIAATTFFDIATGLGNVGKVFGLTATDFRSDGKDIMIQSGCGSVLIRRDIKWGVENGFLAAPYFIIREVDTGGRDFKDDKLKSYKEHVLNNKTMKDRIFNDAKAMIAAGKSVLILVDEVVHGEELSKALGIPFATGEDKKSQDYVDQLNAHKIQGLVGTDGKISEGTDTKNVDVLILANFVASKGPVIQCLGRALRRQGTKTKAIILDYIPMSSTMLKRHALQRMEYYLEITDKVKYVPISNVTE